jgi:MFS family permease
VEVAGSRTAGATPVPAEATTSVETARSWVVATAVLAVLTCSYGAPLVVSVGLKEIAADLGSPRSVPALAGALVWMGFGLGAIVLGQVAERIGVRWTTAFGGLMLAAGLALSALGGGAWSLVLGHAVFVGLLGGGAINIPLTLYVTRWFDRRRGSAIAYIQSGQYVAGVLWPSLIAIGIATIEWRSTMVVTGVIVALAVVPIAFLCLPPAPESLSAPSAAAAARLTRVGRLSHRTTFLLLCVAGFLCCTPMSMPTTHLVALCSDLGIAPARGATMLSVLLGCAFLTRQFWGWMADRVGGLKTILAGSVCQAAAVAGLLVTQDEVGLFVVSAAFGLGFSGIIPAYVIAVRELFPANEASWRMPVWFFSNLCGMTLGGWLAGHLYDRLASYAPAFATGLVFNLGNIAVIGWMVLRQQRAPAAAG